MFPFTNYNHENAVFYGKKVGEMTQIESDLLLNDMLLILSQKTGTTKKELVPIIAMRYTLISNILKIDVDDDNIGEVCEEIDNSIYSFQKFQEDLNKNSKDFNNSERVCLN